LEIRYKGFIAKIFFSADVGMFYGEVLNADHLITFQALNLDEAKQILYEVIDHYLLSTAGISN